MLPSPFPTRHLFITGTDTGVGKTVTACALIRALRRIGLDVGAMKPIETGVGQEGPLDAIALHRAAQAVDPLDDVCPLRFALAAAPNVAAAAEGRVVDLRLVESAFARLCARHQLVVAEGAGGLLVPTTDEKSMADLAHDLDLAVLVVCRGTLGTISHTRLTLEVAQAHGLTVCGVVISHLDSLSEADAANLEDLRRRLGDLLIAEIPPLTDAENEVDSISFDLGRLLNRSARASR